MKFPLMHVKNGDPYHSDHRPVMVSTEVIQIGRGGGGGFKFEANWIKEEDCRKVIEEAWDFSSGADRSLGESLLTSWEIWRNG